MAAVKEVTLFPNSAKISETAKINPQCSDKGKCLSVITLPSQADPESLVVSLPPQSRVKIEDLQAKPIQVQDEAKIAELRKQIAGARRREKRDAGKVAGPRSTASSSGRRKQKQKQKQLPIPIKLADAIGKNVQKAHQEKFAAETQLEKIEKNIKKLQEELNQAAGQKETAWEITLTTSGSGQNEISFSYTYSLAGCGWLPLYRIEALPADKIVSFSWEAEIWQSSGEDWKQVQLNLATLQPIINVDPPELPEWIIRPRKISIKITKLKIYAATRLMEKGAKHSAEDEALGECPRKPKTQLILSGRWAKRISRPVTISV